LISRSITCAGTLDVHLDEQNLGDRIKGSSGFHFVDVAQNTVALEQQVLKLLAAERAGTVLYRLDAFGISPVFGVGEVVDLYRFAGCSGPSTRSRSRGRSFVGQLLIRSALMLHALSLI